MMDISMCKASKCKSEIKKECCRHVAKPDRMQSWTDFSGGKTKCKHFISVVKKEAK